MKKKSLLGIALTLVVFTAGWTLASSFAASADHESVRLPILKVFSAKDGQSEYRAYLVKWKEQEVIVPDTLVKTNYQEGESLNVLVMRNKHPDEKKKHELLSFAILPERPKTR